MAFSMAMSWHEGEEKMHKLMRIPAQDNPTSSMLTPQASFMFQRAPLLALGTLDAESRPWTTLWGGSPGFSQPLGGGLVGTRTLVDGRNDPVVQALVCEAELEKTPQPNGDGKLFAGLAIDLMTRKRVKVAGRMLKGIMRSVDVEVGGEPGTKQEQLQLVTKIEQSLGNCPKYLNQYELQPALVNSTLISQGTSLSDEAKALISDSDMFFLTTSTKHDMDVNHRGGPPGFVRIISPTQIAYPEYSGNRLYQSLGNLQLNPKLGLTFPNYTTGSILYLTGEAEILAGTEAASLLPSSTLAIKITIHEMRYITHGLPFRGTKKAQSPYNPPIRTLATEGNTKSTLSSQQQPSTTARLLTKTPLTPTITRYTFSTPSPFKYTPGQWIALDFSADLDTGYAHMRDSDPKSLNDDFIRTFTISSAPPPNPATQFEITIRNTGGPVTSFLSNQNPRAGTEVLIRGVGGDFLVHQLQHDITPFIAGGVGITPLLGQVHLLTLAPDRFRLLWVIRSTDAGLVRDTFLRFPELGKCAVVFFTGEEEDDDDPMVMEGVERLGAKCVRRRLGKGDVDEIRAETWYLCAGKGLRKQVLAWLGGKKVVFEDFDY